MNAIENYVLPEGRTLGLKVVYEDGRPESLFAPEGFRWNLTLGGETVAPDWRPKPECGRGLHLWAWAQGDLDASDIRHRSDVIWLAVEYETATAVDLGGKAKVPKSKTVAVSSDRKEVVSFIKLHTPPENRGLFFFEAIAGDRGIAVAGDGGYAKAGYGGAAIAGDYGTAEAGARGTAEAGKRGDSHSGGERKSEGWSWGQDCLCP